MSIEEIAAKITKTDWQLFQELAAEVEIEVSKLDALLGHKHFRRISAEAFGLHRDRVQVIVSRKPGALDWNRLEVFSADTLPKKDSGFIELGMNGYWLHGQRFSSTNEAALYLIDRLT
jgi:hypothetical protein